MARLLTCGFEVPNYPAPFDYYINTSGQISWDAWKRSGAYSLKMTGPSAGSVAYRYALLPSDPTEVYIQMCWRPDGTKEADNGLIFYVDSDVTTRLLQVKSGIGQFVTVLINGTVRITSTSVGVDGVNLLEVHFKMADAGTVELRINGVNEGSWSGDTLPGADTKLTKLVISPDTVNRSMLYDDICVNDVSGTADNSWIGGSRIIALRPDAAGDLTQWTPNTGANYAAVDEVTPDGDTTYVATDTADKIDLYNLAAPSLPTGAVINRVWVQAVAKKMDAGVDDKVSLGVKSGATTDWSTAKTLSTAYELISGTDYTVNPDDSEAWEEADLNALQAGIKAA